MSRRTAWARTFLFVPGDRPDRFEKAVSSGADVVVLDLEDAVLPDAKSAARRNVGDFVLDHPGTAVRLNAARTPWYEDDLAAFAERDAVLMIPKAEDPSELARIAGGVTGPVVALVETARGILAAPRIADAGVARMAFGSYDLAAELGVSPDDRDAMAAARGALVLASAAAGLPGPIDGVTGNVTDDQTLLSDTQYAKRLGFTARLCIHPRQVAQVDAILVPTEEEVAWADAVVRAAEAWGGGGVTVVDGRMVDKPVIDRAARLLAARRTATERSSDT